MRYDRLEDLIRLATLLQGQADGLGLKEFQSTPPRRGRHDLGAGNKRHRRFNPRPREGGDST